MRSGFTLALGQQCFVARSGGYFSPARKHPATFHASTDPARGWAVGGVDRLPRQIQDDDGTVWPAATPPYPRYKAHRQPSMSCDAPEFTRVGLPARKVPWQWFLLRGSRGGDAVFFLFFGVPLQSALLFSTLAPAAVFRSCRPQSGRRGPFGTSGSERSKSLVYRERSCE